MTQQPSTVIIGVIGNDIHVVANRVLQICLESAGIQAINIGVNNTPEDFVDTALEVDADALLIGSLNGEAPHWCRTLRPLLNDCGLDDILVYLGGNVVTGGMPEEDVQRLFRELGIDRIYYGATDFDAMLATLKKDLRDGCAQSR